MKNLSKIILGSALIIIGILTLNWALQKLAGGEVIFSWLHSMLLGVGFILGGIFIMFGAKIRDILEGLF